MGANTAHFASVVQRPSAKAMLVFVILKGKPPPLRRAVALIAEHHMRG
jgi:hypothetical protein